MRLLRAGPDHRRSPALPNATERRRTASPANFIYSAGWGDAEDVANAVLFLCSDDPRSLAKTILLGRPLIRSSHCVAAIDRQVYTGDVPRVDGDSITRRWLYRPPGRAPSPRSSTCIVAPGSSAIATRLKKSTGAGGSRRRTRACRRPWRSDLPPYRKRRRHADLLPV